MINPIFLNDFNEKYIMNNIGRKRSFSEYVSSLFDSSSNIIDLTNDFNKESNSEYGNDYNIEAIYQNNHYWMYSEKYNTFFIKSLKKRKYKHIKDNNLYVKRKFLTKKQKDVLLEKQRYSCANVPFSGIVKKKDNVTFYDCPFWKFNHGIFDESGYEADHITEFNISNDNSIKNFQLLCTACHSVKTKRCSQYKYKFSTKELDDGQLPMDTKYS